MTSTPTPPFMPWMLSPADMQKMWAEFMTKAAAMPKVMQAAAKAKRGFTPAHPVHRVDKLRLLQYETETPSAYHTPLLVVFALVNRPYILDLKEGKSVVQHFLRAGFDTYNIDWGIPSTGDRDLGMDDYIERYMDTVVDFVRERSGAEKINILGYCMGGTMSAIYTALHPDKVKNLTLLAAPVDWSSKDHLLAKWTDKQWYDVDRVIDTYGNAPAELLQSSFALLRPVGNLVEKYINFYENMDNEKFLEDFFAMEMWLNDNIPVAGEMFRQFVKYCMQENRLIQGRLMVGGHRVDLKNITCPVLNLMAEQDHLVPCGQSSPFNDAVGSSDRKSMTLPAGHIGLAVGSKSQRDLWPKAVEWLAARSDKRSG